MKKKRQSGFTLIEVMIAVAIIAILVSIALPSYTSYVARGKIQEATTNLLAMRVKLEQFYQDNRTYSGACAAGTVAPMPSGLKYFVITCPTLSDTAYIVRASGQGDLAGLNFEINEANVRSTASVPTGWTAPGASCWVTRKSGQC